jgi:transcriptional regulator with XRE-family HTH domain
MIASLVAESSGPIGSPRVGMARLSRAGSGRFDRHVRRNRVGPVASLAGLPGEAETQVEGCFRPVSPPGVIGGAVIRAARKSARISRQKLARVLAINPRTLRGWESGTCPLFLVAYDDLRCLAAALDQVGAKVPCELAELVLASQCDLLIAGMLRGLEDYAEVPPVDEESAEGQTARDLLRWALVGVPPARHETFTPARPLLATHDLNAFDMVTLRLSTGSQGDQLVSYGRALTAIRRGRLN